MKDTIAKNIRSIDLTKVGSRNFGQPRKGEILVHGAILGDEDKKLVHASLDCFDALVDISQAYDSKLEEMHGSLPSRKGKTVEELNELAQELNTLRKRKLVILRQTSRLHNLFKKSMREKFPVLVNARSICIREGYLVTYIPYALNNKHMAEIVANADLSLIEA